MRNVIGTIRRLAAKALIQELQHEKQDTQTKENNSTVEQRITNLSMNYQILSPYTAFVGIEMNSEKINNTNLKTRYVPIQISKGDEHLFSQQQMMQGIIPWMSGNLNSRYKISGSSNKGRLPLNHLSLNVENMDIDSEPVTTTTPLSSSFDPVRWLIDQQSFNGAWLLNETDIERLTNGKSLNTFQSTITKAKDTLTTALAIAILELKYTNQKNLWNAIVGKGRKQLNNFGLTDEQINLLINEIKSKL